MIQGVCIDTGQTDVLEKGMSYYLFPNGVHHYYVSRFTNHKAHKGCFQAKYFRAVQTELWPEEPAEREVRLDPEKLYKAKLIWRKPGYRSIALKEFFVKPKRTHGYFYHDSKLKNLGGCFPLHWFTGFEEVLLDSIDQEIPDFDIEFEENDLFSVESEPKIAKYEQLSIFDF